MRNIIKKNWRTDDLVKEIPEGLEVIRNEKLNKELFEFLTRHRYQNGEAEFVKSKKKVRPSKEGKETKKEHNNWKNYYDKSTLKYVREKEKLLLSMFKRIGIDYEW
ncbi:hypothetical protein [Salinibacter ruber]|uniref:hypothetical protein n=1 Tax=Salinibacter ruber TaxID=146919 RepID=UPI00216981F9|nr:hypothetical protein [Salinibacter ruber]